MSVAFFGNDTATKSTPSDIAVRMSSMSLAVSAGAVRPPPWRLIPLLFDSSPPIFTVVWISLPITRIDVEHDQAVVEQQHVARFQVARQVFVVEADAIVVAEFALGVEDERLAGNQRDLAVFEFADPDLRALQVGHDGDFTAGLAGRLAHEFGALAVVVGGAVREIEPHHVEPCLNHLQQDFRRTGSRSDGSDNLGGAMHESPRLDGIAGMSAASRMRRLRTEGCCRGLRAG